jgi:hypothetical protein
MLPGSATVPQSGLDCLSPDLDHLRLPVAGRACDARGHGAYFAKRMEWYVPHRCKKLIRRRARKGDFKESLRASLIPVRPKGYVPPKW